jgi:hypothetical protein
MGFFSWFRSCGTTGNDQPPNLVQLNNDPRFDEMRQAALEDIAQIEQDNRDPGGPSPDQRDESG